MDNYTRGRLGLHPDSKLPSSEYLRGQADREAALSQETPANAQNGPIGVGGKIVLLFGTLLVASLLYGSLRKSKVLTSVFDSGALTEPNNPNEDGPSEWEELPEPDLPL